MQRKTWALVPLIMTSVMVMADGGDKTRGIGKYPGRKTEACIPERAASNAYGNQAWMRTAWASSSIDYNLTAQLVTDGITTVREPARVRVLTSDGEQDLRDKEKTFDGKAEVLPKKDGGVRMDYMVSQDGNFAAVQLLKYVPYAYEPASSVLHYTGEEASAFVNALRVGRF